jgi:hypothetical protein
MFETLIFLGVPCYWTSFGSKGNTWEGYSSSLEVYISCDPALEFSWEALLVKYSESFTSLPMEHGYIKVRETSLEGLESSAKMALGSHAQLIGV